MVSRVPIYELEKSSRKYLSISHNIFAIPRKCMTSLGPLSIIQLQHVPTKKQGKYLSTNHFYTLDTDWHTATGFEYIWTQVDCKICDLIFRKIVTCATTSHYITDCPVQHGIAMCMQNSGNYPEASIDRWTVHYRRLRCYKSVSYRKIPFFFFFKFTDLREETDCEFDSRTAFESSSRGRFETEK